MKKRICILFFSILTVVSILCGCGSDNSVLSKENPTTITVWHYYSGHAASQFQALVTEFNNTVGLESGVVVTAQSMSTINDLELALWDAVDQKVGAPNMPDIFQCYPDTAAALRSKAALVNFDDYVTEDEKLTYVRQFLDAGYLDADHTWNLFPVAKSTEVLMLNKTDWDKFAADTGAQTDSLLTWEGLAQTAADYYEWSGGKAFFGRDAFANYPIIGSSQLGHELFRVSDEGVLLDFNKTAMKTIWDNFYVPYVNGYYRQVGNFRSDDVRLGEVIAIVCSSASASYFPDSVTCADGKTYPIECMVLPLPNFADTPPYAVAQGAGMAVTKSTYAREYASVLFLKWFTQSKQNLRFCASSGYLPVSLEASNPDVMSDYLTQHSSNTVINDTILTSLSQIERYVMYAPAGFEEGTQARAVLEHTLLDAATTDRSAIEDGALFDETIFDERFAKWYADTLSELKQYCK